MTRVVSRNDDPVVTLSWTVLVGLVLMAAVVPFAWHPVAIGQWALLALTGILFGTAHFLVIRAFASAPASLLAPFTYAQIVAAIVVGVALFGDLPDAPTAIGTCLVIGAGIYVMRSQGDP